MFFMSLSLISLKQRPLCDLLPTNMESATAYFHIHNGLTGAEALSPSLPLGSPAPSSTHLHPAGVTDAVATTTQFPHLFLTA